MRLPGTGHARTEVRESIRATDQGATMEHDCQLRPNRTILKPGSTIVRSFDGYISGLLL
jgi:hypothetical protein